MSNKVLNKITSCGAIPWRKQDNDEIEILLIKQFAHRNIWGIPKGHIHDHETHEQCAVREVKEETGVLVVLEKQLSPVSTIYGNEEKTVYSWLAKQIGDSVPNCNDPDGEVADVQWFNIESLPIIHVYQRPLVHEAISFLKLL
jgi:8-oxo-dGTP pyrophosphatase MutT (NUDIX family)